MRQTAIHPPCYYWLAFMWNYKCNRLVHFVCFSLTFSGHDISNIRCRHVRTLEFDLPLRKLHSCCRELPRHLLARHLQSQLPE